MTRETASLISTKQDLSEGACRVELTAKCGKGVGDKVRLCVGSDWLHFRLFGSGRARAFARPCFDSDWSIWLGSLRCVRVSASHT